MVSPPRQAEDPIDVVAYDGGLGAGRVHHAELLDLLGDARLSLLAHLLGCELILQLLNLVLELVLLATELLLNGLHLLIQVVLLLRLLHLLLDARSNLAFDLKDLDLGLHDLEQTLEARFDIAHLEQRLTIRELDGREVGEDGVREPADVVDGLHGHQDLGLHLLVELDVNVEARLDGSHEGFDFDAGGMGLRDLFEVHEEVGLGLHEPLDSRALLALDQDLHGSVGQAK